VTVPPLRHVIAVATAGLLAAGMTSGSPRAAADPAAASRHKGSDRELAYTRWGPGSFRLGRFNHTRTEPDLVISGHPDTVTYRDPFGSGRKRTYHRGRWFSPWVHEAFGLTELIASYNATTPVGTFIEISVRGRTPTGRVSSWDSLGRWASHDRGFHRMSLGAQSDDLSRVAVDTLVTHSRAGFEAWQLRVTLMRRAGSARTPSVRMVGAVASRLPSREPATSKPHRKLGRDLDVPEFSQQIHVGEYPQWNGGGEAWCSPTSTAMLLAYWHRGPTRRQYAWVDDSYRQPWVDYAARATYAWGYDGTGDWPFNTAYAGTFGLDSFVTRLRSLRQAELFIRAGIPLVASISFDAGELDGAPIASTAGHLLVIRGFTPGGKVVVNDPAAPSASSVRRVYRRGQFERAWVGSTGGVVYVIHPPGVPLPPSSPTRAW
jgi:hypothetical protein